MLRYREARAKLDEIYQAKAKLGKRLNEPHIAEYVKQLERLEAAYELELVRAYERDKEAPIARPIYYTK